MNEEMTKEQLCKIICQLLNIDKCTQQILSQINKYVTEHGWSYKEIARALAYYIEVEGGKWEQKYGIAIVKFKIDEARKHYNKIAKQRLEEQQRIERAKQTVQVEVPAIKITKVTQKELKLPLKDITKF